MRQRLTGVAVIIGIAGLCAFIFSIGHIASGKERIADDASELVGNWTGESICVGNNPACHDEKVVYRISKASTEPGKLIITMDKIVDGKPETMGVMDFKYDGEKRMLVGEFKNARYHGVWEFTVKGETMEGTLSLLPAKTIVRRVKVKKDK
jgi:hypothetical protein